MKILLSALISMHFMGTICNRKRKEKRQRIIVPKMQGKMRGYGLQEFYIVFL